jgi:LysR family hydrogen peroxide-inducible transcriptional activator
VAVARLPVPRPSRTIGIVWRKSTPLSSQLAEVAEIVRQAAGPPGEASEAVGATLRTGRAEP